MESSPCLKLFSDSSSQFGEDLKPKKPLQSNSYIYIPFVLPGLLFRATTSLLVPFSSLAGATPPVWNSPPAPMCIFSATCGFSWPAHFILEDTLRCYIQGAFCPFSLPPPPHSSGPTAPTLPCSCLVVFSFPVCCNHDFCLTLLNYEVIEHEDCLM